MATFLYITRLNGNTEGNWGFLQHRMVGEEKCPGMNSGLRTKHRNHLSNKSQDQLQKMAHDFRDLYPEDYQIIIIRKKQELHDYGKKKQSKAADKSKTDLSSDDSDSELDIPAEFQKDFNKQMKKLAKKFFKKGD